MFFSLIFCQSECVTVSIHIQHPESKQTIKYIHLCLVCHCDTLPVNTDNKDYTLNSVKTLDLKFHSDDVTMKMHLFGVWMTSDLIILCSPPFRWFVIKSVCLVRSG